MSHPITLLALWVYWQYIVLTLKTFIWSHQCNRNVLQSCVVFGQLAAASQCNIKNITILHSSRMQRLLLNQAQKNLMNKLKENGTLKAVHCENFFIMVLSTSTHFEDDQNVIYTTTTTTSSSSFLLPLS